MLGGTSFAAAALTIDPAWLDEYGGIDVGDWEIEPVEPGMPTDELPRDDLTPLESLPPLPGPTIPQVPPAKRRDVDAVRRAAVRVTAIDRGEWPWWPITPEQTACKGGRRGVYAGADWWYVDGRLMNILQSLAQTFGPLTINSGYRSPEYNAWLRERKRGVARNSFHRIGFAADVSMETIARPGDFVREAARLGCNGFGFYPSSNFIHVDIASQRSWGRRPKAWRS